VTNKKDKVLGLDVNITRRDFLGATLVGSGTALLSPRLAVPAHQMLMPGPALVVLVTTLLPMATLQQFATLHT